MEDLKKEHEKEMGKVASGIIAEAQEKMKAMNVTKVVKIEFEESTESDTWKSLDLHKGLSGMVPTVRKLKEKVTVE